MDTVTSGPPRGLVPVLLLATLAGCSPHIPVAPNTAPVPDGGQRMTFPIATDETQARQQLDFALGRTVCLVRSGKARECQTLDPDTTICTPDSSAKVRARYQPA